MVTGLGKTTMFYQALFERETSMLAANRLTQIGNERMSGDCLLPALAQRTSACLSASLWTASGSARQTVQLSVSISTTATKHLPRLCA